MSDTGFSLPKPGKEHNLLTPFAGTFRAEVSYFTGNGTVHKTNGTMVTNWSLDGLYLDQHYQSDSEPGVPSFKGRGYWGYNFSSHKYEGFWIDSYSSVMQLETGAVDSLGTTWEMFSEVTHPMAGPMKKRSVIQLIDNDHHQMESYVTGPNGHEVLTMLIQYERAAS